MTYALWAVLLIVWYFVIITLLGLLTGAWPCKECARARKR